jgi:hypothetical protein
MNVIEILKRSDYHYRPTDEQWQEIWNTVKQNDMLLDDDFINDLFNHWTNKGTLSQKQMYHLIKTAYPEQRTSLRD